MGVDISTKFLQPSRLPKRRQQVAAVCYRIGRRGIEFLLVQTRGGRWIFPKGGVEFSLTHAQSAALEAFEEAGVHGRMEETPFARYFRRKTDTAITKKNTRPAARSSQPELAVTAHLCEVSRLEAPQESNRNPTWFSAEKAKQRLLEDRALEFGAELARVVDRASARIRRLHGNSAPPPVHARKDALQEVRFEAFELARVQDLARSASYARYIRREHADLRSSALRSAGRSAQGEIPVDARLSEELRSGPPLVSNRPTLRLGNGTACLPDTLQKVQFIDEARPAGSAKAPAKSAKNRRK